MIFNRDRINSNVLWRWSGITAERLLSATHTISSIQNLLLSGASPLITPHTILLGHSLECDLNALRIRHPLCIDTALIYKHPRGPPFKPGLKWLSQKWLQRDIQAGENGHDSEEDARACVDLLKMKLANGKSLLLSIGHRNWLKTGPDFGDSTNNMEPIVERIGRYMDNSPESRKTSAYCDYGDPRWLYGAKATTAVRCTSDDDVVNAVVKNVQSHTFVFGRMMELSEAQGCKSTPEMQPNEQTNQLNKQGTMVGLVCLQVQQSHSIQSSSVSIAVSPHCILLFRLILH